MLNRDNFAISETESSSWEGKQEKSRQYIPGGMKRCESICLLRVRQFIAGGMWGVDCGGKRSHEAYNFYFKAHWMYFNRVMNFCHYVSLVPCETASSIPKLRFEKCCVGFPLWWSRAQRWTSSFMRSVLSGWFCPVLIVCMNVLIS